MDLDKLCSNCTDLLQYMEASHYSANYIKSVEWELKWIRKMKEQFQWCSYVDIYNTRISSGRKPNSSAGRIYHLRSVYSLLQRYEENGEYPDRTKKEPLIKWASYYQLTPAFKEIIDLYVKYAEAAGRKETTIRKRIYKGSCFLRYFQDNGHASLETVTEQEVLGFFTDSTGKGTLSSTYKREIASILNAELGSHNNSARRVAKYLPSIQKRRKNIRFLTAEEAELIRQALSDNENKLTCRERAVGALLYFTGLRAKDIAELRFPEIDWKKEQIVLSQHKTGGLINLPLSAYVGNKLYDYIVNERPNSEDDHVFLWSLPPYLPIDAASIWPLSAKIYKAAGIRQNDGDRRGSHLFRHHLATTLAECGISQPVISETLGHEDPSSLDHYLSTDIVNLRKCALSIEVYPVGEEVLCI